MVFSMGNGKRVKLWKNRWCGNEPLNVSFLSFALTSSKEA